MLIKVIVKYFISCKFYHSNKKNDSVTLTLAKVKVIFIKCNGNSLGDISNVPLFTTFSSNCDLDLCSRSLFWACFSKGYIGAILWHKFHESTVKTLWDIKKNIISIFWRLTLGYQSHKYTVGKVSKMLSHLGKLTL